MIFFFYFWLTSAQTWTEAWSFDSIQSAHSDGQIFHEYPNWAHYSVNCGNKIEMTGRARSDYSVVRFGWKVLIYARINVLKMMFSFQIQFSRENFTFSFLTKANQTNKLGSQKILDQQKPFSPNSLKILKKWKSHFDETDCLDLYWLSTSFAHSILTTK